MWSPKMQQTGPLDESVYRRSGIKSWKAPFKVKEDDKLNLILINTVFDVPFKTERLEMETFVSIEVH